MRSGTRRTLRISTYMLRPWKAPKACRHSQPRRLPTCPLLPSQSHRLPREMMELSVPQRMRPAAAGPAEKEGEAAPSPTKVTEAATPPGRDNSPQAERGGRRASVDAGPAIESITSDPDRTYKRLDATTRQRHMQLWATRQAADKWLARRAGEAAFRATGYGDAGGGGKKGTKIEQAVSSFATKS